MKWTFTSPILSHNKNYRFEPLTNNHQQTIIKYCMTKDVKGLIMFMQQLLQELSVDKKINFQRIPVIDQMFLLIRIRSLCINTRLEVKIQEENDVKHTVTLVDIQKSINKNYLNPIVVEDPNDSIYVTVHYPVTWEPPEMHDYITGICIDGTDIDIHSYNNKQLQQIVANLPNQLVTNIQKKCNLFDDSINKMTFLKMPGNETDIVFDHSTYSYYLKLLFSDSLSNFIELMYVFVKVLNMSLSDVMDLTPADTQIYYQMYIKEMNEREKVQKQSRASNKQARDVPLRYQ